jgi:hypothetical protein
MENKVIKVNRNAIAKGFNEKIPAAYKANLSKEKVKYAFAFCIKNNLNPAKNEVSLIFNKAGEAVPVVNYEYQLDKFGKLGYRHEYVYIPSVIDAIAIECIIFKGEKKIGSYIAYVDE